MGKKAIVILLVIGALLSLFVLALTMSRLVIKNRLAGRVYDCKTGQAIDGVEVKLSDRNWGFRDGTLVWDNDYISAARSATDGFYAIDYHLGNSLRAHKEGYLDAYDFIDNEKTRDVGLISEDQVEDKSQLTYQCKLSSECEKQTVKNDVTVFWNSCTDPNYRP